jgi:hypothetical protein
MEAFMRKPLCVLALSVGLPVFTVTTPDSAQHRVVAQALDRDGEAAGHRGCTLKRLRGTFNVLATGTVVTPPPGSAIQAGPFATVGTLSISGYGNAVLNATRSFNGQIFTEADLPGTVTLGDNCTGSAEFQGGRTFNLVVLNDSSEMHWIQTNPGTVVTVVFKRQ